MKTVIDSAKFTGRFNQMEAVLFVAFSHQLTSAQIEGFKEQIAGGGPARIITLASVAPELLKKISVVPATASLEEIKNIAKDVVSEAIKAGATHFYFAGEPTLMIWANLYANQFQNLNGNGGFEKPYQTTQGTEWASSYEDVKGDLKSPAIPKTMVCIQSTTERVSVETVNTDGTVSKTSIFSHVQWRKLF